MYIVSGDNTIIVFCSLGWGWAGLGLGLGLGLGWGWGWAGAGLGLGWAGLAVTDWRQYNSWTVAV